MRRHLSIAEPKPVAIAAILTMPFQVCAAPVASLEAVSQTATPNASRYPRTLPSLALWIRDALFWLAESGSVPPWASASLLRTSKSALSSGMA